MPCGAEFCRAFRCISLKKPFYKPLRGRTRIRTNLNDETFGPAFSDEREVKGFAPASAPLRTSLHGWHSLPPAALRGHLFPPACGAPIYAKSRAGSLVWGAARGLARQRRNFPGTPTGYSHQPALRFVPRSTVGTPSALRGEISLAYSLRRSGFLSGVFVDLTGVL